jgi:deoxyhypusine synthase
MIRRFGKEIDDESSIYYWAYKVEGALGCQPLVVMILQPSL